ncbi:hypothetical protein HPB48_016984 [Haemaphysalis longicornis]|uniref:Uncharacterized protein n=1 Tax=Haemaphysalis longicornis TaxID=44386 RepID=A0A9J6GBX4_HAELO|nr:hypothetical protein HPB48_016984 [Haemaphysalis longicornis]
MRRPTSPRALGSSVGKNERPATRATGSKGKLSTKWKPRPMPKPAPQDYVIVIKPRQHVSLHEAFPGNRATAPPSRRTSGRKGPAPSPFCHHETKTS